LLASVAWQQVLRPLAQQQVAPPTAGNTGTTAFKSASFADRVVSRVTHNSKQAGARAYALAGSKSSTRKLQPVVKRPLGDPAALEVLK